MKELEYYSTKLHYPQPSEFTKVFVYKEGRVVFSGTVAEFNETRSLRHNPVVEKVCDDKALAAARAAYRFDVARLILEFKADLLEDSGVTGHPKAEKCFSLAWDHGHSAGLSEVKMYFEEFVELLR